jgi:hypothetical protein
MCTSADGQRKEFIVTAGWPNASVLNTLNYVHAHTDAIVIDFICLRVGDRRVWGGGVFSLYTVLGICTVSGT